MEENCKGTINKIPEKLTRRYCVSKVAQIFDIAVKLVRINAAMKLDLHELLLRKLDWDDKISDLESGIKLIQIWNSNFKVMSETTEL